MSTTRTVGLAAIAAVAIGLGGCSSGTSATSADNEVAAPQDFSGIAWMQTESDGDPRRETFLVAHDVKNDDEERDLPRLSRANTPTGPGGIKLEPLDVVFPDVPNDLESIARLPGRNSALLAESNDDGDDPDPSIYLARWDADLSVTVPTRVAWPETPKKLVNVEATAVVTLGGQDWFLYAERADGSDRTPIHMTTVTVADDDTVTFGKNWQSISFISPAPADGRPASAMDISAGGIVYVSSAKDPGDFGPFDSSVYKAAKVEPGNADGARLVQIESPIKLGQSNGLKIEALALTDQKEPLFFGDDDEDYGGLLRPLG